MRDGSELKISGTSSGDGKEAGNTTADDKAPAMNKVTEDKSEEVTDYSAGAGDIE